MATATKQSAVKSKVTAKKPAAKTAAKSSAVPANRAAVGAAEKKAAAPAKKAAAKPAAKPVAKKTAAPTPVKKVAVKPAAKSTAKKAETVENKAAAKPVAKKAATVSKVAAKPAAQKAAAPAKKPAAKSAPPAKPVKSSASSAKKAVAAKPASEPMSAKEKSEKPVKATAAKKSAGDLSNVNVISEAALLKMPEKDYMNDVQLAFFRHRLMTMREEILANARVTGEHLKENEVFADPNDRATVEEENMLEQRVRDRERKLLKKIDSSLRRIDEGEYGYCLETGEPIGLGRLLARPTAELSIEAQEKHERLEKLYAD